MKKRALKEFVIIGVIFVCIAGIGFKWISNSNPLNSVNSIINDSDDNEMVNSSKLEQESVVYTAVNSDKIEQESNNYSKVTFDLSNSIQTIYEGTVEVEIINVEYNNKTLNITGEINNNSGESIIGHVSNFYIKDVENNIIKLDFFSNPTFNIDAPSGGKTKFQMVYDNVELSGNKLTIGGEFFKLGYFGQDNKINLEVNY